MYINSIGGANYKLLIFYKEKKMEFKEKLQKIQCEPKAPKNLFNSFGKYKYRNAEGICEAVKANVGKV